MMYFHQRVLYSNYLSTVTNGKDSDLTYSPLRHLAQNDHQGPLDESIVCLTRLLYRINS